MAILLVCLCAFSIPKKHLTKENAIVTSNDSIPAFLDGYTYEHVNGTLFSFDEVKGKVVLLDFWATWCGPCIREHPYVVEIEERFNGQDFQVVTVSVDKNKSKWQDFLEAKKWSGIHIKIDNSDVNNPLNQMVTKKVVHNGDTLHQTSVPQYYLIGKDLSIEKIKDIKSENTIALINKKINM